METEELTKLVDGIYKNILDKFNPGARQMITAGKAYLKALHGAAAASRLYVDAVGKLGRQAQQGTWGGCADIGTALMKVVEVYREIQDQQMNILKAFYVDLLVPLETNLEKDTKVVQSEQKRFMQQHKLRSESYSKAAATMKKQRKKKSNMAKSGTALDKEMKSMQILEEEKTKLDAFCEQSLKNAMTQERRRYGFVLERQCSLAKHWLAHHSAGAAAYGSGLEDWLEVARTREYLPPNVEAMFVNKMRQVSFWADDEVYASPRIMDDDDRISVGSALRKTRSVDASCLDVRSIAELGSPAQGLSRAKSDFNLQASMHADQQESDTRMTRPSSLAPPPLGPPLARALYAYAAAGDNQLSFQQGDVLVLLGERTKGWQYGENNRTHSAGWFPLAYTELITNENGGSSPARWSSVQTPGEAPPPAPAAHAQPHARMFGDTLASHHAAKGLLGNGVPGLPPTLPAPSPGALSSSASANFQTQNSVAASAIKNSTSAASFTTHAIIETRNFGPQTLPTRSQVVQNRSGPAKTTATNAVSNVSLHSSNDSGFSNEPPPQPDIDYSDEEAQRLRVPISKNGYKAYPQTTQSLKRTSKSIHSNGYLTDDQQIILRNLLEMDKDGQKVKRTKSFWKFGRTSEDIMEGMCLWKHRDIVDTVSDYKKKYFDKIKNDSRLIAEKKIRNGLEKEESLTRQSQTIDRKDKNNLHGLRQVKSLSSIQIASQEEESNKNHYESNPVRDINAKSISDKFLSENNSNEIIQRNESRQSDMTNSSTIKTNFENSFYNDENGKNILMKTVKRREILQRYDNDSSSELNSISSSLDPYDCVIVNDHMISKQHQQALDRQGFRKDRNTKNSKENCMTGLKKMDERLSTSQNEYIMHKIQEKIIKKTNEHMKFKTFKDNAEEINSFSASSETLKYKNDEQNFDRYGIPIEQINGHFNGQDGGTLKYKNHSRGEESKRKINSFDADKKLKKEYSGEMANKFSKHEIKEPRVDYSLKRLKEYGTSSEIRNAESKNKNKVNRNYDDTSLQSNHRKSEKYYDKNLSYFSDQENNIAHYDYETDSKKAEKSKLRSNDSKSNMRDYRQTREGYYSESDDHKFNESLKQQRPQLLPRTKLFKRTEEDDLPQEGHTFGPWYDLWGRESVAYK